MWAHNLLECEQHQTSEPRRKCVFGWLRRTSRTKEETKGEIASMKRGRESERERERAIEAGVVSESKSTWGGALRGAPRLGEILGFWLSYNSVALQEGK
jgi:hypothetical protein